MKISKTSVKVFISIIVLFLISSINTSFSQEINESDPRTFKYFKINANADDDSVFVQIQDEMAVDPKLSSYTLIVNVSDPDPNNHYVVIGEETDASKIQMSWILIPKSIQQKLLNWAGTNKINLQQKKYNYASVFTEVLKNIKFKDLISPPKKEREILSTTAYINPFLNAFGADPLGIPLKKSFGFSFQLGTPYSGPLETDMVGANFHLLGARIGITSRIYEFVLSRGGSGGYQPSYTSTFGNYNNIFTPLIGIQASYVIPFGNFFEVGYFKSLDSGYYYDPPKLVLNKDDTLKNGRYMKNSVITNQGFFNWELRYPIRTFGSSRAKIYVGQYLGEFHAGYIGRELRFAGSVFDLRMNYTFPSQKRNWQFLIEAYVANIGESFANSGFAIGPSLRITKGPDGKVAVVTALVNARFKLGDFYEEK